MRELYVKVMGSRCDFYCGFSVVGVERPIKACLFRLRVRYTTVHMFRWRRE